MRKSCDKPRDNNLLSLIKIFKTVNGRDVIDGRGIEPDVKIDEREMSRLTATIYSKNFLFNYATSYFYNHPEIIKQLETNKKAVQNNEISPFAAAMNLLGIYFK